MFIGLCAAYIGSYIGKSVVKVSADRMPIIVVLISAACMAVFEFFI